MERAAGQREGVGYPPAKRERTCWAHAENYSPWTSYHGGSRGWWRNAKCGQTYTSLSCKGGVKEFCCGHTAAVGNRNRSAGGLPTYLPTAVRSDQGGAHLGGELQSWFKEMVSNMSLPWPINHRPAQRPKAAKSKIHSPPHLPSRANLLECSFPLPSISHSCPTPMKK